jgi:hypothetical protein
MTICGTSVNHTSNKYKGKEIQMGILNDISLRLEYPSVITAKPGNIFIGDISGKDSIAAIFKTIENNPAAVIIPSIIELGCEYGDKKRRVSVIEKLSDVFNNESQGKIMPGIISDINELWKTLAASNIYESFQKYGFYSPCIACHLVFHLVRIKIAQHLKAKNVISGERELHSDKEKINQLDFVLDFYNALYDKSGLTHHLPLRYVKGNEEIDTIIEKKQMLFMRLTCLFSGNYYKANSNNFAMQKDFLLHYVIEYLPELLKPSGNKLTVQCIVL